MNCRDLERMNCSDVEWSVELTETQQQLKADKMLLALLLPLLHAAKTFSMTLHQPS